MNEDPETVLQNLWEDLEDAKSKLNSIRRDEEHSKVGKILTGVENTLNDVDNKISELIDSEDYGSSNKNPLISKTSSLKTEIDIIKSALKKKKEDWNKNELNRKFNAGEKMSGIERKQATRNALLSQNKEVDMHGDIINEIGKNVGHINNNLDIAGKEIINQGEQINRVNEQALEGLKEVKRTDRIISQMSFRQKCMKFAMFSVEILLGIFDVVWLFYWVFHKKND